MATLAYAIETAQTLARCSKLYSQPVMIAPYYPSNDRRFNEHGYCIILPESSADMFGDYEPPILLAEAGTGNIIEPSCQWPVNWSIERKSIHVHSY